MTEKMSYKDAVIEFQRQQSNMRTEIHDKLEVIISNQSGMQVASAGHEKRLDTVEDEVVTLIKSSSNTITRKVFWSGLVAVASAIAAAISYIR